VHLRWQNNGCRSDYSALLHHSGGFDDSTIARELAAAARRDRDFWRVDRPRVDYNLNTGNKSTAFAF
jgi:hypothetical protein